MPEKQFSIAAGGLCRDRIPARHAGRRVQLCCVHPLVTSSGFSTLVVVGNRAVYIRWLLLAVSARWW